MENRRAGGLLVRVGVLSGPPLNLRRPLVVLFVSTALSSLFGASGIVDGGSGQENLLNTKLLNLGIPYLALDLLQLAGSKLHWV